MSRRIIGQCNTSDFKDIEHLASLTEIEIYSTNLSPRQKAAVRVLSHFQSCGVPFEVLLKLREVLVWEMPDKGLAFEYKLLDARDSVTQNVLWTMQPRKIKVERR
ncbi:MAG: hypothetical protein Q8O55_07355 [Dehalococcoidales bacterium]|nr:hypothetical protein [Dehalococcoidales bacterium]